jgi:hypothetical protein
MAKNLHRKQYHIQSENGTSNDLMKSLHIYNPNWKMPSRYIGKTYLMDVEMPCDNCREGGGK